MIVGATDASRKKLSFPFRLQMRTDCQLGLVHVGVSFASNGQRRHSLRVLNLNKWIAGRLSKTIKDTGVKQSLLLPRESILDICIQCIMEKSTSQFKHNRLHLAM